MDIFKRQDLRHIATALALFLSPWAAAATNNIIDIDQTSTANNGSLVNIQQAGSSNVIGGDGRYSAFTTLTDALPLESRPTSLSTLTDQNNPSFLGVQISTTTKTFSYSANNDSSFFNPTGPTPFSDTTNSTSFQGGGDSSTFTGTSQILGITQTGNYNFLSFALSGDSTTLGVQMTGNANVLEIDGKDSDQTLAFVKLDVLMSGKANTFDIDLGRDSTLDDSDVNLSITGNGNTGFLEVFDSSNQLEVDLLGNSNSIAITQDGGSNTMDLFLDTDSSNMRFIQNSANNLMRVELSGNTQQVYISQGAGAQ